MKSKIALILFALVFFYSCQSTKDVLRDKTKTKTEKVETTISKRNGDTIAIQVPTIVYKDTIITKRGKTTTLNLKYNNRGLLDAECISDEINELKQIITNIEQKNNIRDKHKETIVSNTMILYVFLGLAFLIIVYRVVSKFI